MKKILTLLLALSLALTVVLATSCTTGEGDGSSKDSTSSTTQSAPVVEVTELDYVYDGTAKQPTVKVTPAGAGNLSVSVYRNGAKVTEAVDAGTYDVKVSLSDPEGSFEDISISKQMVIAPKPLDVSAVKAEDKQYDKTNAYEGKLSSVGGICEKDDVSVKVKGDLADSLIGENKTVTVKEVIVDGADKANYTVTELKEVKISVVRRSLTISGITVSDRDPDGTTDAEYTGTPVLENVIAGDEVSVEISKIEFPSDKSGSYDMKVTATLSGKDADKYVIGEVSGIKGKINSKAFTFDSENGIVTGYTGEDKDVVIPSKIKGVTVKGIGEKAFTMNDNGYASVKIKSITLPDTLETIGESAFANTELTTVTIPKSVKSVGAYAFYYCSGLTEVVFEDGMGEITLGASAFRNTAVKNVKLPSGLKEIPALCFQDTTGDGEFVIPSTVTKLGDSAFLRSKYTSFVFEDGDADLVCEKQVFAGASMKSFEIPARMVEIGGSFFQNAVNLTTLTFAKDRTQPLTAHKIDGAPAGYHLAGTSVTSLDIPGCVGEVPDGMANDSALKSLTLGEGITKIGPYAFYGTSLTTVTFPKSLTEIGNNAFQGSAFLEEVKFEKGGTDDLVIGAWSFQACAITALEIPARTTSLGAASFAGNKIATLTFESGGTKSLVFEDGADEISQGKGYQFDQCPLTKVVLPKRTVKITLPNVFIATTEVTYES